MDEKTRSALERCIQYLVPPHDPALEPFFREVREAAEELLGQLAGACARTPGLAAIVEGAGPVTSAALDPCADAPFPPLLACCVRLRYVLDGSYEEIAALLGMTLEAVLGLISDAAIWHLARREPAGRSMAIILATDRQQSRWQ